MASDEEIRALKRAASTGDVHALERLLLEAQRRHDVVLAQYVLNESEKLMKKEHTMDRWKLPDGHPQAVTDRDLTLVAVAADADTYVGDIRAKLPKDSIPATWGRHYGAGPGRLPNPYVRY